jgi:hypothetical protein
VASVSQITTEQRTADANRLPGWLLRVRANWRTFDKCQGRETFATRLTPSWLRGKRIVGADLPGQWLQGYRPNERQMKYPLEVGGELLGPQLMVVGFPRERQLKFRVGILFPATICRLDYADETHANSVSGITDLGLPPAVVGPHYHSWPLNRHFFHGTTVPLRLHNATPYPGAGRSFDAILRWYCDDTNIEPPPANHAIDLPPPELV